MAQSRRRKIRVLIVSDGKRGHVHQSEGVVRKMRNIAARKIEIRMGKLSYLFLILIALLARYLRFSRGFIWLCLQRVMRVSLVSLVKFSPDMIISAGSLTHPATYLLGRIWNARTVVCMRPSVLPPKSFDLVVVPRHDSRRCRGDNVIYTMGATSTITEGYIFAEAVALYSRLKGSITRPIGLLVGGNSAFNYLDADTTREIVQEILLACEENDFSILCCSSRRTPPEAERILETELGSHKRCAYLLLASESAENPVPGIIGLCEVVVVTEDSVSMVSEIIAGGKSAVVVEIGKKKKQSKFEIMYKELMEENLITYTKAAGLNRSVVEALARRREAVRALDESGRVAAEIEQRFFTAGGGTGVRQE
ncbi:MAG: ELM1/GtrOC1 family putative glycosyltransferase [bacterium]